MNWKIFALFEDSELLDLIDFRPYEPSIEEAQKDIKTQNIQYASPINRSTYFNEGNRVPFHFNPSVPPPMTHYPPQTIGAYGSPYYGEQERRAYNSFYPQSGAKDSYGVNRRPDWVDDNSNTRAHTHKPVTVPRHISYDGTGSWRSFFVKFTTFAEEQQWTGRQRKNNLCWCLQGKASDYFAMVMEREPNLEYFDLVRRLEKRFSTSDLPSTLRIYEWADRVASLGTKAYIDMPENLIQYELVLKFCQGCIDNLGTMRLI